MGKDGRRVWGAAQGSQVGRVLQEDRKELSGKKRKSHLIMDSILVGGDSRKTPRLFGEDESKLTIA